MPESEDEILARELAKIGGMTGGLGGKAGAGLMGRLLPKNTFELKIEIKAVPRDVLQKAFSLLSEKGTLLEETDTSATVPTLAAVIGSGFMNMNPAIVTVEVVPLSEGSSQVSIRGVAKEGLIKQRAGEKAARQIGDLLQQAFV
ncbi:hypothetical protein TFLX_00869 [Thermoflexales bacterium]|nr:hypothetical protein TFLX_00869 [Thermoflexales bacterium]